MKIVKIFAALVGLTFVFLFCSSNDVKVTLKFLEYSTPETYLFLYVLSAFVLGMIAASFGSTLRIMQLKRQLKKIQADDEAAPLAQKSSKKSKNKKVEEAPVAAPIPEPAPEPTPAPQPPKAEIPRPADQDAAVQDAVFEDDAMPAVEGSQPLNKVMEAPDNGAPAVIELPAAEPAEPESEPVVNKNA
jgi:uncharacterized integral membrane protein